MIAKILRITTDNNFRKKVVLTLETMALRGCPATVAESLRTVEQQALKVAKGLSKTMASNHLAGADGLARAADICHAIKGWDAPRRFWWILGANCHARGMGWGGLFGLDYNQREMVVSAIKELRRNGFPLKHELYQVKLGWDVAHVENVNNWPLEDNS